MRGVTEGGGVEAVGEGAVSIHTPHAGCDHDCRACFQQQEFQSTHPMRGVTKFIKFFSNSLSVSIHTPHAGCDIIGRAKRINDSGFNPHTPCGV